MKFPGIGSAAFALLLVCQPMLAGQAAKPSAAPAAARAETELYPDQGFLSPTRYTNHYFGFAFDLPPNAQLQPIPRPAASDGRIQLLQLGGPPPDEAAISVAAVPIDGRRVVDAKTLLRKSLDQELFIGVEELHGLSKATLGGRQFYWYETRRGIDQLVTMATNLNGHVLIVLLGSRSDKVLKELQYYFQQIVFFPPSQARHQAGADAQPYEGPAISTHRLAQLKADPPAKHIDPGAVRSGFYENRSLGFSYRIPENWTLEDEGAVEPALERVHQRSDPFDPPGAGRAEHELAQVCERTLFSAWAERPGTDGHLSYDDFGEVTAAAAPAACFPGLNFPANSADREAVKDFLLQFGLTHPIVREMRDAKAFSSGDNVFIFLHGTVALKVSDDNLARRLSVGMSITERNGYLLTWFFAAPHDTELRDLLEQRASFDPPLPNKHAPATKPGGGSAAADVPSSAPQAAANASAVDATPNSGPPTAAQTVPKADSDSSSKPTLLRPGETMKDQQPSGAPVSKH